MTRRHLALGDGQEACETRLGSKQIVTVRVLGPLRRPITYRQQFAVVVEQEGELHRERHFAAGLRDRVQTRDQGLGVRGTLQVQLVAFDRGPCCLQPENDFSRQIVRGVDRLAACIVDDRPGGLLKVGKLRRDDPVAVAEAIQTLRKGCDRGINRQPPGGCRRALMPKRRDSLARQPQGIGGAGEVRRPARGNMAPLLAGIGEDDKVPGQIAAVDRRNIVRFEHAQVACVVPIVEMPAKAREPGHGGQRFLEALDGVTRSDPAEVAGAGDRQQVHADIGGRSPAGQDRVRGFLEIVRREHVVGRRHRGFEKSPGPPRDLPQHAAFVRRNLRAVEAGRAQR